MIKNVFFDLDGTLTDSREGIINGFEYALNYFGIKLEDRKYAEKFIGPSLADSFRSEYKFDDSLNNQTLSKEYDITSSDVNKALKQDKYDEGNINPFTPKNEVTIYNEPTLNVGTNPNRPLTPSDK